MSKRIPNLWRLDLDATRLYQQYLCQLMLNGRHERVVDSCHQIQRFAAQGPGSNAGLFTFFFQINSLCELKDYESAWRRLRRSEEITFGKRIDLKRHDWSKVSLSRVAFDYAPLLFFRGRERLGCHLLEESLGAWFERNPMESFEILFHVYNSDEYPANRCGVTLLHFYERLSKSLQEWRHWKRFVNGFDSKLFRLSGVPRDDLLSEPDRLADFFDQLMQIREKRTTSGVTYGQVDLIQSAARVQKRHEATRRKKAKFNEETRSESDRLNNEVERIFPELRKLPK